MGQYWVGAVYLLSGDGYRTVLESLRVYGIRLRKLRSGGNVQAGGMFGSIIGQAAAKREPEVRRATENVLMFLAGMRSPSDLVPDIPVMNSALDCYRSELDGIVEDAGAKIGTAAIDEAKRNINEFTQYD